MNFVDILFLSIGLAMDAFAVSICAGTKKEIRGFKPAFRLSFHFGLFQFLMPVIGWFAGFNIQSYIQDFDHWIAFGLLAFIGVKMIMSGLDKKNNLSNGDPSKGMNLIMLSVATSIDALAVGFSLAIVHVNIWYPSIIIGIITAIISLLGLELGYRMGIKFGKKMEIVGGIILILIGVKILFEHLFF
jgi:manganese efflux pump family protein